MLRVVRCTLHRHCRCHYQKCRCRIHLLRYLQCNHHPILYHLAAYILQEVLKIVVVEMLVFLVVVVVVVFLCYIQDSSSSVPLVLQVLQAHLETVSHWNTKAYIHRPYFWSTPSYKGQFLWASGPCNACIGNVDVFFYICVVFCTFRMNDCVFFTFKSLQFRHIPQCFFHLRYNRFQKNWLTEKVINSSLIYIFSFLTICSCWYIWFLHQFFQQFHLNQTKRKVSFNNNIKVKHR